VLCSYKKPGRDTGFFVLRNLKDWTSYTKKYPQIPLPKRHFLCHSEMFRRKTNSWRNYFPHKKARWRFC